MNIDRELLKQVRDALRNITLAWWSSAPPEKKILGLIVALALLIIAFFGLKSLAGVIVGLLATITGVIKFLGGILVLIALLFGGTVYDYFRERGQGQQDFDAVVLDNLMLETLTELHDQVYIRKPIDVMSVKMFPPTITHDGVILYQYKATMIEKAPVDSDSLEDIRLIIMSRTYERLMGIYPLPEIYLTRVQASGNRYVYHVLPVVDSDCRNYVEMAQNQRHQQSKEVDKKDEEFSKND